MEHAGVNFCFVCSSFTWLQCIYRGADKSLARPGRKHATVTKL